MALKAFLSGEPVFFVIFWQESRQTLRHIAASDAVATMQLMMPPRTYTTRDRGFAQSSSRFC